MYPLCDVEISKAETKEQKRVNGTESSKQTVDINYKTPINALCKPASNPIKDRGCWTG